MFKLELRPEPSRLMGLGSPLIAAALTLVSGYLLFTALGTSPGEAFWVFFVKAFTSEYGLGELALKSTPLILCAIGLAVGFRANVWNIGAEGQLTIGALAGAWVGLFSGIDGPLTMPLMLLAGALGGMAWAAIPAFLRTRFNTSEILVSLMLVYVARLLLLFLVHGPWRDPDGFNFPQSAMLSDAATLAPLVEGTRVNGALVLALVIVLAVWFFVAKTLAGYRMSVAGLAPAAARYAGFSEKKNVWLALLLSGATAGLAGIAEVAGPIGQLQPQISPGYGFAAIIVAFVGRLHPVGIVLASVLMSLLYLGGESAQMELQLPNAITGLFQGVLLFYLLAADLFINFRLVRKTAPKPVVTPVTAPVAVTPKDAA